MRRSAARSTPRRRLTQKSGASTAAYSPTWAIPATRLAVPGWKMHTASTASASAAGSAAGCAEPRPRSATSSARLAPNAAILTSSRAHDTSPKTSTSWQTSWKTTNAGTQGKSRTEAALSPAA